jgi:hypothetical protein
MKLKNLFASPLFLIAVFVVVAPVGAQSPNTATIVVIVSDQTARS